MNLDELFEAEKDVEYKIYVDMDGVLVNFLKGIEKKLGHPHSETRYQKDSAYRKRFWSTIMKYSKDGHEFWFELEPMDDMRELWNYVKKYDPEILTATGTSTKKNAGEQKRKWIKKHLGSGVKVNVTEHGSQKGPEFGGENKILIDDQQKSIKPWKAAGGVGILHTSAAKTIKRLKKLGL